MTCKKDIMVVMGDDFMWGHAADNYKNLDNLITLMNSNPDFVS